MEILENSVRKYHQSTMKINAEIRVQTTKTLYLEDYWELSEEMVIFRLQSGARARLRMVSNCFNNVSTFESRF